MVEELVLLSRICVSHCSPVTPYGKHYSGNRFPPVKHHSIPEINAELLSIIY